MRPYITFHETPGVPLRYPLSKLRKDDARFIGGTVDWRGPSRTTADLKNMVGFDSSLPRKPWLHITLSLPVGLTLDNEEWLDLVSLMLDALEFPADAVPFLCFKHPVSKHNKAEHIHVLMLPKTFIGQWLSCEGLKRRCDHTAEVLRHKLGMEACSKSPFTLYFADRKQKYTQHQHIASMVNSILQHYQPVSFDEFRDALWYYGEVRVDLKPNFYGIDSYVFGYQCLHELRGGELSKELTPKNLALMFQLNSKLRDARFIIDLRRLLNMEPEVKIQLCNFLRDVRNENGRHFHEDHALLSQRPVYAQLNAQERHANAHGNGADQDRCERVAATPGVVEPAGRAGARVGQRLTGGARPDIRAIGSDREFDFQGLGQSAPSGRTHHGASSPATQGKHPIGANNFGRSIDSDFVGQSRSYPSRRANIDRGSVRRRGLGSAMMQAKRLAARLGLVVKATLMRATRSLGLKFEDSSALLLSATGCRLTKDAWEDCHAKIFARAYARAMDWYDFQENTDWLVPSPSMTGDWMTAPRTSLAEIRSRLLATSQVHVLSSGSLDINEVTIQSSPLMLPPDECMQFKLPSQKYLFVTPSCIAGSEEALAIQIQEVDSLAATHPSLRVVEVSRDGSFCEKYLVQEFLANLNERFAALQDIRENELSDDSLSP